MQGKCITIPTRTTSLSKEKGAALGGTRTHDTLLSRQSALPTELPGQLSKQGSKYNTTQHHFNYYIYSNKSGPWCYVCMIQTIRLERVMRDRPGIRRVGSSHDYHMISFHPKSPQSLDRASERVLQFVIFSTLTLWNPLASRSHM